MMDQPQNSSENAAHKPVREATLKIDGVDFTATVQNLLNSKDMQREVQRLIETWSPEAVDQLLAQISVMRQGGGIK